MVSVVMNCNFNQATSPGNSIEAEVTRENSRLSTTVTTKNEEIEKGKEKKNCSSDRDMMSQIVANSNLNKEEILLSARNLEANDQLLVEVDLSNSSSAETIEKEKKIESLKNFRDQETRGFKDTEANLCVVSDRLGEYFESIKGKNNETLHLYQLFKSVRTEAIACLLMTLIHSKSLIISHTIQVDSAQTQIQISSNNNNDRLLAHLFVALINSFAVASLVQIFGHISGCHLIPSISIALYIKSHISRLRLILYLFAQLIGTLLAVILLLLLTSSQISSIDFLNSTSALSEKDHHHHRHDQPMNQIRLKRSEDILFDFNKQPEVSDSQSGAKKTIALQEVIHLSSVIEQLDEGGANEPAGASNDNNYSNNNNYSSIHEASIGRSRVNYLAVTYPSKNNTRENSLSANRANGTPLSSPEARASEAAAAAAAAVKFDERKRSITNAYLPAEQSNSETRNGKPFSFNDHQRDPKLNKASALEAASNSIVNDQRRRKRDILLNSGANGSIVQDENNNNKEVEAWVNLLELALPEQIMSNESVLKCIHDQKGQAFCLTRSNGSQMFIIQLIATVIINLTYLVNVDPRRVDQGFKSLSIGLAYFVCHAITIHSGGFYPNPFQVVLLSAFSASSSSSSTTTSTTSGWRLEWFVYLITPIIGGLFAALSHDYVDFRGKDKRKRRLYLRRSFNNLNENDDDEDDDDEEEEGEEEDKIGVRNLESGASKWRLSEDSSIELDYLDNRAIDRSRVNDVAENYSG